MAITISNPMDSKVALYVRLSKEDGAASGKVTGKLLK